MEQTKKMNKGLKITLIVLGSLIALVALVLLGFRAYMRWPVASYYSASEKAFEIPGLDEDFVPQGFCYDAENNYYLVSGYMKEKAASPVYIVDADSGEIVSKALLHKDNGEIFTGHSGGIAQKGDYVYIAGSSANCLYIYSYTKLLEAGEGGAVERMGKFPLKRTDDDYLGASYVTVSGDRLIVGEYRFEPGYTYPDSHKVTTSTGEIHGGLAIEYAMDEKGVYGIVPEPVRVYSIRDKVQGIWMSEGKIYLSTSHGLNHSLIYVYDESKVAANGTHKIIGRDLPLYVLDDAALEATYKIAPMSEELFIKDGKLYVMCESASSKYIFGKFIGGKWCYATDLSKMKVE